jgi:hypothetical protein
MYNAIDDNKQMNEWKTKDRKRKGERRVIVAGELTLGGWSRSGWHGEQCGNARDHASARAGAMPVLHRWGYWKSLSSVRQRIPRPFGAGCACDQVRWRLFWRSIKV